MRQSKEEYKKICKAQEQSTKTYKNLPAAFCVGGTICATAQGIFTVFKNMGLEDKDARGIASWFFIVIGVLLTAFGVFDKIAKISGAGTLVPITGFANSIASTAMEFKSEGCILGTCVKMFTIAGPVLTFGITASVIYGVIYYFLGGGS